jgi:hypothetical protein
MFILGWTPRGRATASATALFGPWPNSSIRRLGSIGFALPSAAEPCPGMCRHIIHNISEAGRLRHRVPAMGVAKHQNRFCCAWVWGGPRLLSSTLHLQLRQSGSYASERFLA